MVATGRDRGTREDSWRSVVDFGGLIEPLGRGGASRRSASHRRLLVLPQCQHLGAVVGDEHGVLELGGERAVDGHGRPAVGQDLLIENQDRLKVRLVRAGLAREYSDEHTEVYPHV